MSQESAPLPHPKRRLPHSHLLDEAEVFDKEVELIERNRVKRSGLSLASPWFGLGLSGGGIRSASLAIGVLQALAKKDLLKYFDYVSSVSGGGYAATSLQWWWSKPRQDSLGPPPQNENTDFGVSPDDFPYGPVPPDLPPPTAPDSSTTTQPLTSSQRGSRNLEFLRAHASYLTSGNGLSFLSMVGVLGRTVAISLMTWIPILTAFFVSIALLGEGADRLFARYVGLPSPLGALMPARWLEEVVTPAEPVPDESVTRLVAALARFAGEQASSISSIATAANLKAAPPVTITPACVELCQDLRYPAIFASALWLFYLLLAVFLVLALLFAFVSRAPQDPAGRLETILKHVFGAVGAVAMIYVIETYVGQFELTSFILISALGIYASVAITIVTSELVTARSLNASYWLRRSLEYLMGKGFIPSLLLLSFSTIPILPYFGWVSASTATHFAISSLISLVSGVASSLYGYYTFVRNVVPSLAGQIAATVGSFLYLYATLIVAYILADCVMYARDLPIDNAGWLYYGLIASIVIAFAVGFSANINYVGFHRFYRDRLMEAFMPPDKAVMDLKATYSAVADNMSVAAIATDFDASTGKPHPYPLINCNVILVNDDNQKFASRGGDSFIISPLSVGSRATGWRATQAYINENGPLTLASAMAASGAAANASAGYVGTGITMNPLVSAVMSLLNIRLGLWVGSPGNPGERSIRSIPTFLTAGIYPGVIGTLHRSSSRFLELTDGGHFENLGLYELVRRGLELILIVDGEDDPTISLSSLVSAARRIEQDFGAQLELVKEKGPERLVMYPAAKGYPAGVRYAEAPYLVGRITYQNGTTATLIYLKAAAIKEMDFLTAGYLAANPLFPHQSTADQFFTADQFDAYRLLGHAGASRMIDELNLAADMPFPSTIYEKYAQPAKASGCDIT